MEWRTMTAKQLAERLDGREYLNEITAQEEREAEANGLVAVYGYSDDCVEFVGYIDDEVGAFEGKTLYVTRDGIVDYDENEGNAITALCDASTAEGERAAWVIDSDIPHETFNIYEDGELFCVGIVFRMEDLK